jgi:hypothetical protein
MPYSTTLDFGRYAGVSLCQVIFRDPDWFFWAYESGVLSRRECGMWAPELAIRAKRIRVPPQRGSQGHWLAEYTERGRRLVHVGLVHEEEPCERGSLRLPWLDLGYARTVHEGMDKQGSELIVRAVKLAWYGHESARMDRDAAEAFFRDGSRFMLAVGAGASTT